MTETIEPTPGAAELKPCPFCGSANVKDVGDYVECFDCRAGGPLGSDDQSTERWNARQCPTPHDAVAGEQADFAWLVEAPGPNYLGARAIGGFPDFFWTSDATKALRFWTKEQADFTAMAVRRMEPRLWDFALTLGDAFPRQHGFVNIASPNDAVAGLVSALGLAFYQAHDVMLRHAPAVEHLSSNRKIDRKDALSTLERFRVAINEALANYRATEGVGHG